MPLLSFSSYEPPRWLKNAHAQTVWATVSRRVGEPVWRRERIETPDGDFLDLDWSGGPTGKVAVVLHGLEGNSRRTYVRGMALALNRRGWEVAAVNFRGCSGEPNRRPRLYHSGVSEDLDTVVRHVNRMRPGTRIDLVGFSLGGNVVLKYLGECGDHAPSWIGRAVAVSVPCDLGTAQDAMSRPGNELYMRRFLADLRRKLQLKLEQFPGLVSLDGYERIRSFREFDERYTAPLHGFAGASDYYRKASSIHMLLAIRRPALILNALDDPFLSPECHPGELASNHPWVHLESTDFGGHVGFVSRLPDGEYWSERRAAEFLAP